MRLISTKSPTVAMHAWPCLCPMCLTMLPRHCISPTANPVQNHDSELMLQQCGVCLTALHLAQQCQALLSPKKGGRWTRMPGGWKKTVSSVKLQNPFGFRSLFAHSGRETGARVLDGYVLERASGCAACSWTCAFLRPRCSGNPECKLYRVDTGSSDVCDS